MADAPDRQTMGVMITAVVGAVIVLSNEIFGIDLDIIPSIGKPLVISISASIIISLVLLKINKRHQNKINRQIREIRTIVVSQDKDTKKKKGRAYKNMLEVLKNMEEKCTQISMAYQTYEKSKYSDVKKYKSIIEQNYNELKTISADNLDSLDEPGNYFENDTIQSLKMIYKMCNIHLGSSAGLKTVYIKVGFLIHEKITLAIKDLENALVEKFTISTDRNLYFFDNIVYVTAKVLSVRNHNIVFEVFNEDEDRLIIKKINPEKSKSEDTEKNLYKIHFEIRGKKWKDEETYVIKATYNRMITECSFNIRHLATMMYTDKGNYDLKDDIVIGVVDPNSCKDVEKIGYVGDKNPKLTIKSSYGKIKRYRLKEIDKSAGIFDGKIRIITVRDDNSRVPIVTKNGVIKKTRGKKGSDGYIEAKAGDSITFIYKNKYKDALEKTITIKKSQEVLI